ncbi:MAG TPA: YceI family protein [Solirubrobacterales bacterium]|jgi:polyisoprenoid-binding protein YceI|nr:YceI family protein [Solirubrobacterales bacterium]
MYFDSTTASGPASRLASGTWILDPERSSVEFRTRLLFGVIGTVKGGFGLYRGTLDMEARPAIELTIAAGSIDTGNVRRDAHLRSAAFFDADEHPEVRFESESAELDGEALRVHGTLRAAGGSAPLDVTATVRPAGEEFELEASAVVDQRKLGMTYSPLGTLRPPAHLTVRGHLIRW